MQIKDLWRVRKCVRPFLNYFTNRAIILAYHRVADLETDPQLLSVSRQNFQAQLDVIRTCYKPVSLQELLKQLQVGRIIHKSVVITFDDGYVDNLWYVKPLLERYETPASVFVTMGYVGKNKELWWDELERLLLHTHDLPMRIELDLQGQKRIWNFDCSRDCSLDDHPDWNVATSHDLCTRFKVYRELHGCFKVLSEEYRTNILLQLHSILGASSLARDGYRVCNPQELVQLVDGGLISVGAHSITHPALAHCSLQERSSEIMESKHGLESILGKTVSTFSYPFGSVTDIGKEVPGVVKSAGYDCAVANYPALVTKRCDCFLLPRFLVRNWSKHIFEQKMSEWFNG